MSAVRLVTFNVHHGVGDDGRHDLTRLARVLSHADPDVVCLQEVDRHYGERSEFADQALLLSRALDRELVWSPSIDEPPRAGRTERRQYGNALLSRLPVLTSEVHRLPGAGEPRSALRALVRLPDGALWVTATHLSSHSATDRAAQAAAVAALSADAPGVLVGDLNADAGASELGVLRERFADAWPLAAGPDPQTGRFSLRARLESRQRARKGLTHPARRPRVRIDQVWMSPGVTVTDARVLDGAGASDHHPLLVDLQVTVP